MFCALWNWSPQINVFVCLIDHPFVPAPKLVFRGLFWPGRHGSSCRKSRFRLGSLLISIVVFPKFFCCSGSVMNIIPYLLRCIHENDRNMICAYFKLSQSATRTTKFRSDEPAHLRLRHLIAVAQKKLRTLKKSIAFEKLVDSCQKTHSFPALTSSFSDISLLVNKNRSRAFSRKYSQFLRNYAIVRNGRFLQNTSFCQCGLATAFLHGHVFF